MAKGSAASVTLVAAFLAACGGGGGGGETAAPATTGSTINSPGAPAPSPAPSSGDSTTSTPSPAPAPAPSTSNGATPAPAPAPAPGPAPTPAPAPSPSPVPTPTPTPAPTPAPAPASAFTAFVDSAPADGATISGTVRISIQGSGIENVELLPESGYAPLYARGTVTGDKTGAIIDFNTNALPDGPVTVRVAAFNQPPGQAGSEISAMPARTWNIKNAATFEASLISAPPNGAFLGFDPYANSARFEVRGAGMRNVELVSARDESIIYGRFAVSADGTLAGFDWRFYEGPRLYETYDLRVIAWDAAPGQPGRRIEVMPARHYLIHLPLGCYSVPTCGGAAP